MDNEKLLEAIKAITCGGTVREASEYIKEDAEEVLLELTKGGLWSRFCSACKLKNCLDCPGLYKLGSPVTLQDRIDFLASLKGKEEVH